MIQSAEQQRGPLQASHCDWARNDLSDGWTRLAEGATPTASPSGKLWAVRASLGASHRAHVGLSFWRGFQRKSKRKPQLRGGGTKKDTSVYYPSGEGVRGASLRSSKRNPHVGGQKFCPTWSKKHGPMRLKRKGGCSNIGGVSFVSR